MKITKVLAREICNCQGLPAIECDIILDNKLIVTASCPSGQSKSFYEAKELLDGGDRLMGLGVQKAINNIEQIIAPIILGRAPDGIAMDLEILSLDSTQNKAVLGSNATLAVSMAIYKAQAAVEKLGLFELIAFLFGSETVTLPFPLFNMLSGGIHANNGLVIQEFMVAPIGVSSFRQALEIGTDILHEFKKLLKKYNKQSETAIEGGLTANFINDIEALSILSEAIDLSSLKIGSNKCLIALDIAASQIYNESTNLYKWEDENLSSLEMIDIYEKLCDQFPIFSIEDGLAQDDWLGWATMTSKLVSKIQIVGDDIFATNIERINQGIKSGVSNCVIIKPNQVGTITESLYALKFAKDNELNTIVSHRSIETNDTFIADLAVGASSGQIKAGGCLRGERIAKYNRLLEIEDQLTLDLLNM